MAKRFTFVGISNATDKFISFTWYTTPYLSSISPIQLQLCCHPSISIFFVAYLLYVICTGTTNGTMKWNKTNKCEGDFSPTICTALHIFEFILSAKFASQIFYGKTCGQIDAANGWAILYCWQRIRFTCHDRFSINSKPCACVTTHFSNFARSNLWRRLLFIFPRLFPSSFFFFRIFSISTDNK